MRSGTEPGYQGRTFQETMLEGWTSFHEQDCIHLQMRASPHSHRRYIHGLDEHQILPYEFMHRAIDCAHHQFHRAVAAAFGLRAHPSRLVSRDIFMKIMRPLHARLLQHYLLLLLHPKHVTCSLAAMSTVVHSICDILVDKTPRSVMHAITREISVVWSLSRMQGIWRAKYFHSCSTFICGKNVVKESGKNILMCMYVILRHNMHITHITT
jgi:hypothetical protein